MKYLLDRLRTCQSDVERWYNHPFCLHRVRFRHLRCCILNASLHMSLRTVSAVTAAHQNVRKSFSTVPANRWTMSPSVLRRSCQNLWSLYLMWRTTLSTPKHQCPSSGSQHLRAAISATSPQSALLRKKLCSIYNRAVDYAPRFTRFLHSFSFRVMV